MKLFYAFLWQENVFPQETAPFLFDPTVNEIGALLLPVLNNFVSQDIETIKYSDPTFGNGKNFYPGEERCNAWDPHAKWHLQTGIALTDFVLLADEMHRLFITHQGP